ncbi:MULTISPECIES: TetR/AcrR family transcriptional regulator [Streptomyces]|uniref:TetR/AcrR family transcriptional regulator n=2 Tax=Streptomyces TaxID=1883 RepID=A0ABV9IIM4_9ACTN
MTKPRRPPTGNAVFSQAVTDVITEAAIDLLVESGYARLTMDGVAKRADVGKSAIYRRWPSKLEMVVAGLVELSIPIGPAPDTGSLRGDVRAVMQAAFDWLSDPRIRAVLPDLIAEADRNPVLAEAVAEHVTGPRVTWARAALHRARDRGELAADDVDLVLDLTIAPVFWRLTHARPVDDQYLDRLTELTIGAVRQNAGS